MREKQSVRKGAWYIEGKRRYRKRKPGGHGFPIELLASATASILGELAKPILKKNFSCRKQRQKR